MKFDLSSSFLSDLFSGNYLAFQGLFSCSCLDVAQLLKEKNVVIL